MEDVDRFNKLGFQMEFVRIRGTHSKQDKVRDFWTFLDEKNELNPFTLRKSMLDSVEESSTSDGTCKCDCLDDDLDDKLSSKSDESTITDANEQIDINNTSPQPETSNTNKCRIKPCAFDRYLRDKELKFADSIEENYEDIQKDLKDFQKRTCQKVKCDSSSDFERPKTTNSNEGNQQQ